MNENYSLKNILLKIAENYAGFPLFHFAESGKRIIPVSYLKFMSDLTACAIEAQNITAKRIAVVGYSSYDWIITTISLMLAGKTLILINPDLSNQDLQHLLKYTDAELIMFSEELTDDFAHLKADYQMSEFFSNSPEDTVSLNAIFEFSKLPEQDCEFLCFTSGTSKSSKGVVISSKALVRHVQLVKEEKCFPGRLGERSFLPLPLFHIYGFTFLFHVMETGATICIPSSPRYILREAQLLDPHVAFLVPSMIEPLFKGEKRMPSLYVMISGGGACREELAKLVRDCGVTLMNGYGSSESIALALLSSPDGDEQWMKPLSFVQCGVSEAGELWMKLPCHLDEYYKKPEDTCSALNGDVLWTGDSAAINQDGFIKILGRLRDTIVMENGEKIHAEDMDQILLAMQFVKDAAVIYSSGFGMAAIIVPESAESEETIQLQIESYNKTISPQLRIHHVWIRQQDLPRTSTGKLKRYQLENDFANWLGSKENK